MIAIIFWMVVYAVIVAASIIFIGKPIEGGIQLSSLAKLLLDWRFLLGGALALIARFVFVIINNLATNDPNLSHAHLTITALAAQGSILAIILANAIFLGEQLHTTQMIGAAVIMVGVFLVLK